MSRPEVPSLSSLQADTTIYTQSIGRLRTGKVVEKYHCSTQWTNVAMEPVLSAGIAGFRIAGGYRRNEKTRPELRAGQDLFKRRLVMEQHEKTHGYLSASNEPEFCRRQNPSTGGFKKPVTSEALVELCLIQARCSALVWAPSRTELGKSGVR
jgi:hypothetical protein